MWRPFSWVHTSKSQCISSQFSSSLKFCTQITQERKRVKVHLRFVHSIILHRGHVLNHDLMRSQCQIWEGGCEKVTLHPEDHPLHQPTSQVLTCYSGFSIPPLPFHLCVISYYFLSGDLYDANVEEMWAQIVTKVLQQQAFINLPTAERHDVIISF